MSKRVVIIGSGPGGHQAAVRAAQLGAHVTIIEQDAIGGTCLNRGCIPTKTLKTSAEMIYNFRKAASFGISVNGEISPDITRIISRKDTVIRNLAQGIHNLYKSHKIEYLSGEATFIGHGKISVKTPNNDTIEVIYDVVILAHGSSPLNIPAFPFDGKYILSVNETLDISEIPEKVIILGGGVNGCEFAFILSCFGVDVTIVEARDRLMPLQSVDRDISNVIMREMKKMKIKVILDKSIENISIKEGKISAKLGESPFSQGFAKTENNNRRLEADKLLVTAGRQTNIKNIKVDRIGVEVDSKGWIVANDRMETTVKGVYAIGDALGPEKIMLAHVASSEGMVAAENALGGGKTMNYTVVPSAIFTFPEAASVGLTQEQACEQEYSVRGDSFNFRLLGKSHAMGEIVGQVKIISDSYSRKILGVHITGPHASDLIAEGALAMQLGATVEDLASTIHAHPTLSEALMEASRDALGFGSYRPPLSPIKS